MQNPLAPPAMQGISDPSDLGFVDVPFIYTYDIELTSNQLLANETVSIFAEADFAWRGLMFTADGSFSVQFQDGQGYFLSAGLILSTNIPNTPGDPWPVFPEVVYPANGRITLNIQDTSASANTGQIMFVGVNRYKISNAIG